MTQNISIEIIQKYELGILKYIDKICRENQIIYFLDYGTLLGAVRHKGFIPWDDDIDISMSRENFEKFLKVVTKKPDSRYKLGSIYNEPLWTAPLPKVFDSYTKLNQTGHRENMDLGVYVDIFIMDGYPDNKIIRYGFIKKLEILQKIWVGCEYYYETPKGFLKKIKNIISEVLNYFIGARKAAEILCRQAQSFSYDGSRFVGALEFTDNRQKNMISKSIFEVTTDLEFEGSFFMAPLEYDSYLKQVYGDYMKLPPVKDRVSHHDFYLEIKKYE